jgi:hypothetical protein
MSADLTVERLIELVSSKAPAHKTQLRLSVDLYKTRKEFLNKKLEHHTKMIQTNYWPIITKFVSDNVTTKTTPIKFLTELRKMELATGNRAIDVLYNYLLEISVIAYNLRVLEENVENSIEYDEQVYEYY